MRDIATDFLYWNSLGTDGKGFPDQNVYLGVEFEVGGTYEDWGFVVVRFDYNKDKDAYDRKVIASGRNLESAIKEARTSIKTKG
jgi:hypothetical protein